MLETGWQLSSFPPTLHRALLITSLSNYWQFTQFTENISNSLSTEETLLFCVFTKFSSFFYTEKPGFDSDLPWKEKPMKVNSVIDVHVSIRHVTPKTSEENH